MINLAIMAVTWLATSFNYYLLMFLLTSFKQVYLITLISGFADTFALATGCIVFAFLGVKKTLILAYTIAVVGGIVILTVGLQYQSSWIFPVLVMVTKYGLGLSFLMVYTVNSYLFPTLFAATAMGLCNISARFFSALSPIFAEMEEPLPMILFTASSILTLVCLFFLYEPKNNPDELITTKIDTATKSVSKE